MRHGRQIPKKSIKFHQYIVAWSPRGLVAQKKSQKSEKSYLHYRILIVRVLKMATVDAHSEQYGGGEKMKLAEALQERADLKKKINWLKERLKSSVLVQEGENPPEKPEELFSELDKVIGHLEELISRINKTNNATVADGNKTIAELIAKKDVLNMQIAAYKEAIENASPNFNYFRSRGSEIKLVTVIDIAETRKRMDNLSRELRVTDNTIQALNWATELL